MYKIFTTDEFEKDYSKLSPIEQSRVKKIFRQLKESGSDIGKPLSRLSFFREKKFDGKRLYFLIYKNIFVVLALGISDSWPKVKVAYSILFCQKYWKSLFKLLNVVNDIWLP